MRLYWGDVSEELVHRAHDASVIVVPQSEYEKQKVANLECDKETQRTDDEIFFEAVGGWNEKGRVFGMGAAAESYYKKPTFEERTVKKSRREYIKSLESQVVELASKNDEQKKELDTTKEGLIETQKMLVETQNSLAETSENFLAFKKQVESFMQANPPHP